MKKLLLMGAVLLSYGSMAQKTGVEQDCDAKFTARPAAKPQADNSNTNRAVPFYTEDFGGGFPAGWTTQDSSVICPWVYSTDGSWGFFNGNSATAGAAGINSTTAANGFLICDIDSANQFTYGQPSGSNYQYLSTYVTSAPIDCSTHTSVILKFEQFYRYNNGVAMIVQVSNNGGTSWTSYNVAGGVANNAVSANPKNVSLNITSTAASQGSVLIRFGWSARVYYWMIDDINLSEADPFDIATDDSWWGMNSIGYQNYKTPLSHAAPITFKSLLTNNTGSALTGSAVTTDISGTSGSVFNGSSTPISIAPAASDTATVSTTWTPGVVGTYTVTSVSTSTSGTDGNLTNNTYTDSLQITSSVMGLDNLSAASQSTASISNFGSNTGQPFKIGNIYQVTNNDFVECVQIGIANNVQNTGKEIFAEVYAYDPVAADFMLRGASFPHFVLAGELGTIISLEMAQAGDVYADEEILVVAGHYGGAPAGTDDVSFMYGQSVPAQTVYGYDGIGDLYYLANPRAIVVRPDFNCGLGLSEATQQLDATVFPNPSNDKFTVRLANETSNATLRLTDLNGRVVLTQEVNQTTQEITLNVAGIANGMYTLHIQSEKGTKALQVEVMH